MMQPIDTEYIDFSLGLDEDQVVLFVRTRRECLDILSDRERAIWLSRNPLDGSDPIQFKVTARDQGVSSERIRQLYGVADQKIRRFMYRDPRRCQHCGGKGWI